MSYYHRGARVGRHFLAAPAIKFGLTVPQAKEATLHPVFPALCSGDQKRASPNSGGGIKLGCATGSTPTRTVAEVRTSVRCDYRYLEHAHLQENLIIGTTSRNIPRHARSLCYLL